MIERFKKGYFARSKAGHDKDTLYVILDRDDRFVYLSDGRLKEVNNPKKRKRNIFSLLHRRQKELQQSWIRDWR